MNRITKGKALVGALNVDDGGLTIGDVAATGVFKFSQTVAYDAFTDGGGTSGTFVITAGTIPVGATFLYAAVTAVTGFAGDTSATLIIGDGTDADRYNTGTPSVFATAANGVAMGDPSGVRYHAAAGTITLTVTSATDFSSVSAGSLTVEFYYLT